MSHEHKIEIVNDADAALPVWIEPWAEEVQVPPHETFTFVAVGSQPGELKVEQSDSRAVVYGWPSSTLSVFHENQLVWQVDLAVPDIPEGMSTQSFVRALFGDSKSKLDTDAGNDT